MQLERKIFSFLLFWKKAHEFSEQANQSYCCLKLGGVFATKWSPFYPISADTFLKIYQDKNGPLPQRQRFRPARRIHSPLCPDMYGLGYKKKIEEGQPVTLKICLIWTVSAFGLLQIKRLKNAYPFSGWPGKMYAPFQTNQAHFRLIRWNVYPISD